ncbi:MAG: segregation/condensation protein A [Oligoflexia bacterium]|nr:segregation/condensation protein A [Oligoflexia bacterium]
MSLQVQIGTFEGPLSLLLFLIKKNEVDICDIPIHEITKQYLEYIQIMKELNLEVAGEFVAMAATLIYIKSRMLVPQYNEQGEEIIDDPRKELVQKLLEYQKYKEAGKLLYKRPLLNRDLWVRGSKDPMPTVESEIILDERGLFALIAAFRQLMKEAVKTTHEVYGRGMSISARLIEIKHRFIVGERIELRSLLSETFTKKELLITFLSVLELCRMSFTRVYQTEAFSSIYIETIKVVSSDVVNRVQEFDSTNAAQTADQLMFKAEEDLRLESLSEEASSHIQEEMLDNDAEVKAVEAGELI